MPNTTRRSILIATTSTVALAAGAGALLLPIAPKRPLAERVGPSVTLKFNVVSAADQPQPVSSQNQ